MRVIRHEHGHAMQRPGEDLLRCACCGEALVVACPSQLAASFEAASAPAHNFSLIDADLLGQIADAIEAQAPTPNRKLEYVPASPDVAPPGMRTLVCRCGQSFHAPVRRGQKPQLGPCCATAEVLGKRRRLAKKLGREVGY